MAPNSPSSFSVIDRCKFWIQPEVLNYFWTVSEELMLTSAQCRHSRKPPGHFGAGLHFNKFSVVVAPRSLVRFSSLKNKDNIHAKPPRVPDSVDRVFCLRMTERASVLRKTFAKTLASRYIGIYGYPSRVRTVYGLEHAIVQNEGKTSHFFHGLHRPTASWLTLYRGPFTVRRPILCNALQCPSPISHVKEGQRRRELF